jgi:hypothetical protein
MALLLVLCSGVSPGATVDHEERLVELRGSLERTAELIDGAAGYAAEAGRIDLQVARWFADYIEWELENPALMKQALVGDWIFHSDEPPASEVAAQRYREHLKRELDGAFALVEQAAARLTAQRDWPVTFRPDWERMRFADGYFRMGDRAVFPGGFNMIRKELVDLSLHPEQARESRARLDRFLDEMREMGVGVIEHGVSLPQFIGPDGGFRQELLDTHVEQIRGFAAKGFKINVLFHWGGDAEVLERRWPGITSFRGNGVALDIDHPGTHELIREIGGRVLPVLGGLDAVVAWDMANEPFFSMEEWSPHGVGKYREWLRERHGTIERLNERWRSGFGTFEEIPPPKTSQPESCPAGEWFDRVSFHNHRVSSFFGFFSGVIREHVPGAAVHLKSQDNSSLGPMPDAVGHGIDREALTPFCQIQGLDTRPLPVTEPRMAASDYDEEPYAFHWLGQSFTYDYLTSLPPSRPIVDFEYHAFSINAIRIPDLPVDHGRATLWLAHLYRLIGNMAWYWHRRWGPDPFPKKYFHWWFRSSLSTQPLAAAEYFHTMLELNAFGPEVERLAGVEERPVRLLVSKSSYIHDQAHIDALHRVYEGSCFHGLRIGFVTEDMLEADGVPEDCRVLIIPNVRHLSGEALAALRRAKEAGHRLLNYGDRTPVLDSYGFPHPLEATDFLSTVASVEKGSAEDVSRRLGRELEHVLSGRPLRVQRTDLPGAFGVMHRFVREDDGLLILLVNVLDQSVTVRLETDGSFHDRGSDVLNGEEIGCDGINLPVRSVRLIRLPVRSFDPPAR